MEKNDNLNDTERSALLNEAFDIILKLDADKLKILLERMGCEIGGARCLIKKKY